MLYEVITIFLFELKQCGLLSLVDFEDLFRNSLVLSERLILKINPGNNIVDVKGKLFTVQRLRIFLFNSVKKLLQIFIHRNIPNRSLYGFCITIGPEFKPSEPDLYILFSYNFV